MRVCLVAVGVVWLVLLGLITYGACDMGRTTGVVEKIEDGTAKLLVRTVFGGQIGYDCPVFDNFILLHEGETVSVLNAGKTTQIFSRTVVFTDLGLINGLFLIIGFWNWKRSTAVREQAAAILG